MKQKFVALFAIFATALSFVLVFRASPTLIAANTGQILITLAIGGAAGLTIVLLDRRISRKRDNIRNDYA
jgi:hypothetical protein